MNRSLTIFLTCAFGALIGSAVALQLNLFWWVGLLIGAVVGYLAYDPLQILRAMPEAWEIAKREVGDTHRLKWMLATFYVLVPVLVWGLLLYSLPDFYGESMILRDAGNWATWFGGLVGFCIGAGLFFVALPAVVMKVFDAGPFSLSCESIDEVLPEARKWAIYNNPAGVLALLLMGVVKAVTTAPVWRPIVIKGLVEATKTTWVGVKLSGSFLIHLFVLVHSEFRLLCLCDAALGTLIGYWVGNALIGALAGGVLGVANYQLVSIRWLKLVPAKA